MGMTGNMAQWLSDLLDPAISDAEGAARNEHLWAVGAEDQEAATMHEKNSEELKQYAELLREIRKDYVD